MKRALFILTLFFASFVLVGCTKTPEEIEPQAVQMFETPEQEVSMEQETPPTEAMPETTYSLEEVALHNSPQDCWTIIDTSVIDATSFFGTHPGGDDNLAKACGKDATEMFENVKKHDPNGYAKAKELTIGSLSSQGDASSEEEE